MTTATPVRSGREAAAPAILLAVAAALVAAVGDASRGGLAGALAAVQVGAALGVARWLHPRSADRSLVVSLCAAGAGDLLFGAVTGLSIRPLTGTLGLGIVAVLVGQVLRRDREEITPSAVAGAACLLVVAPPAILVGLRGLPAGGPAVVAVTLAAAAGGLPWLSRGRVVVAAELVVRLAVGCALAALACSGHSALSVRDAVLVALPAAAGAAVVSAALPRLTAPVTGPATAWWPGALCRALTPLLIGVAAGTLAARLVLT